MRNKTPKRRVKATLSLREDRKGRNAARTRPGHGLGPCPAGDGAANPVLTVVDHVHALSARDRSALQLSRRDVVRSRERWGFWFLRAAGYPCTIRGRSVEFVSSRSRSVAYPNGVHWDFSRAVKAYDNAFIEVFQRSLSARMLEPPLGSTLKMLGKNWRIWRKSTTGRPAWRNRAENPDYLAEATLAHPAPTVTKPETLHLPRIQRIWAQSTSSGRLSCVRTGSSGLSVARGWRWIPLGSECYFPNRGGDERDPALVAALTVRFISNVTGYDKSHVYSHNYPV